MLLFCKDGSREQSQYQVYPAELHCVKKRGVQQEVSFHCNIFSQEQTVKMAARPCNIFVQTCDFLFFFLARNKRKLFFQNSKAASCRQVLLTSVPCTGTLY